MFSKSYTITRLSKSNIGDLTALHFAVYGKQVTGYFEKKYDTAYTNACYLGFIGYDDAIPIAFYGVTPCYLWYNGQPLLVAQSADAMTHPHYRYKGLFVALAKKTEQLCRSAGIALVFGFPNQHSLPALIDKLGFQTTTSMDRFMIPVHTVPLEKIAHTFPWWQNAYRAYSNRVLKKYISPETGIPSSVIAEGFNGLWRNAAYLRYKTYNETFVVTIAQTKTWISVNNGLIIGDMLGVSPENFDHIMQQLRKLAQQMGLPQLQFQTSRGTALHSLFRSRYAAIPSFPVIFKLINAAIDVGTIRFTFADIDIF